MADDYSLDIAEPQVLVYYAHDPNGIFHHHRVLLARLGPGRWVASSPDFDLAVLDLNLMRHIALGRRCPFPAHIADQIYCFDPLSRADLERLRRQAKAMAVILGEQDFEEARAVVWVYADGGADMVGKPVPLDTLGDAVTLGNRGLLEVNGEILAIEEVDSKDLDSFVSSKQGSMGDLRLIGHHEDSQKRRFIPFREAMNLMRESAFKDWSFSGPRAVKEYLTSINDSGTDIGNYHLQWVKNSNVNPRTSVVHEHRNLIEVLRLAITRDQLDASNLQCLELAVRRLVQLEIAVSRSANAPDYTGLEVLLENPISEGGAAATRSLDDWVTSRLKEKAQIAKQTRLYREEHSLGSKAQPTGGGGGDGDNPGGWRKKKKAQPKAGASAAAGSGSQ